MARRQRNNFRSFSQVANCLPHTVEASHCLLNYWTLSGKQSISVFIVWPDRESNQSEPFQQQMLYPFVHWSILHQIRFYDLYYTWTCNEFTGPFPRYCTCRQHNCLWKMLQRWLADSIISSNLTGGRFEPPTFSFKNDRVTVRLTDLTRLLLKFVIGFGSLIWLFFQPSLNLEIKDAIFDAT